MHTVTRVVAALLLTAGCGAVLAQPGTKNTAWHGDLASSRAFLVDAAKIYELKRKQKVTVKAINTIAALEAVADGTVELVGSARPADARTKAEENLEFLPVAWDSLVLVTHPSNPVSNLSLKQIRDVYYGRIKGWQQLGGAAKPINLYANAAPLDGVEYSLRRVLFGNGAAFVAAQRWYINTKQLEDAIAIDPVALGVTTLSNVVGNKKLKVLSIEGVQPSLATVEDGQYLLAIPLYVAARREAPGTQSSIQLARAAFDWFRSEPTLKAEWRKKQLVPFTEGKKLGEIQGAREQWIMAELGIKPPQPPGPPLPLAPKKNKALNRPHLKGEIAIAARSVKAPPARSERKNAFGELGRWTVAMCRPAPVCGAHARPVPGATAAPVTVPAATPAAAPAAGAAAARSR